MNISAVLYELILNLKNIPGPTTRGKIIVIESDDYGGIRMPSIEAYNSLKDAGIENLDSRYNRFDTLEDKEDLSQLFETLQTVKDRNGRAAVISPFVNVANPDFERIRDSGYRQYFNEPFTRTLEKYGRSVHTMEVWRQGMAAGIFAPEYHGREHISIQPWMEKLQEGNQPLLLAFEKGFVAVENIKGVHGYARGFRPEFYFTTESQKKFLHQSIIEGVEMFKNLFGYIPNAFMPGNSVFHPDFEPTVFKAGIPFLVVSHKNLCPGTGGQLKHENFSFRQKIKKDRLNYYIRNCAFEPADKSYKGIGLTIKQIETAFNWHKPAIIATHRVNYTGGINTANRQIGIGELKKLLHTIIIKWPDAVFMSTADLVKHLKNY